MSELNTSLLVSGYKDKFDYISNEQVGKEQGEACINYQSLPGKTNQAVRDCKRYKKIRDVFVPKEKRDCGAIK